MLQMYKVFVNDKPIFVTDSPQNKKNFVFFDFSEYNLKQVLLSVENPEVKGVQLYSKNIKEDWKAFQKEFVIVEAAGGKVVNAQNQTLFIYRYGKWDLPKGHIEIGEDKKSAAIREVEEECGVAHLNIEKKLETTFHIFQNKKGALCLKVVYWFLMRTSFSGTLKPQLEEGITRVQFFDHNELSPILQKTYGNIKLLF
jgi:8-oxo-dGTP pyrophosphatase MutT (NUDIX family)